MPTMLAESTAALMTGTAAGAANMGSSGEAGASLSASAGGGAGNLGSNDVATPPTVANGGPAPPSAAENVNGAKETTSAKEPAPAAVMGNGAGADIATASNDSQPTKTRTPTNGDSAAEGSAAGTSQDTPASSPRRRIKKRRHDDFVYAHDPKPQKPAAGSKPKAKDPSDALPEPQRKMRKRPRKCPAKDSILIEVPLSVTADVGLALKRTRRKRTERIKEWVASGVPPAAKAKKGVSSKNGNGKKSPKKSEDDANGLGEKEGGGDIESLELGEEDLDPLEIQPFASVHGQESVLDYLEAKYVRGVMLDDDDRWEGAKPHKKGGEDDAESDGSGTKGSCYDDEDDWIDDSLLHEDVAGQVLASSAYGMTQIEEEARKRKEERKKEKDSAADGEGKPSNPLEGLDLGEEEKSDGERSDGADSDFDDGFFVNVGDLEMGEGWTDDVDMGISPPAKKKKKKRVVKSPTKDKKGKSKAKTVKKKGTSAKAAAPGAKKVAAKKKKADADGKASKKKKAKKADGEGSSATPKKKKKKSTASVLETATTPKKKSTKKATTPKKEEKKASKKASAKKGDVSSSDGESSTPGSAAKPKKKSPESKEKAKASQLKRLYKRRYNKCSEMIGEMTTKDLPRKPRNKMLKVSVNIPPDKTIGDEITFSNPSVPGQKLKAKIPKKADLEKRSFVVSIPAPKVAEEPKDNNTFSREFRVALYNYVCAYDDWCDAEGEYNESLPEDKQKEFKPLAEKKTKYDEMVEEFPSKLAWPVDKERLQKLVSQERSNVRKKEKRLQVARPTEAAIRIPQKGTEFPVAVFRKEDFQEGK